MWLIMEWENKTLRQCIRLVRKFEGVKNGSFEEACHCCKDNPLCGLENIATFNSGSKRCALYNQSYLLPMPDPIDAKESDYLYIAASQIPSAGKGLFSSILIFKDEVISYFKGEYLTSKEAVRRAKRKEDGYFINCLDGSILDSMHTNCFAKYANDPGASLTNMPKARFKTNAVISLDDEEKICLIAIRTIKAGEEVFCSYGKKYWQNFNKK